MWRWQSPGRSRNCGGLPPGGAGLPFVWLLRPGAAGANTLRQGYCWVPLKPGPRPGKSPGPGRGCGDGIPLMGICGNIPTNEQKGYSGIRQNGFQEMDIISVTRSITKYAVTPNDAEKFPEIISRAYNIAMLGRKGGVIIDFPFNIQKANIGSR